MLVLLAACEPPPAGQCNLQFVSNPPPDMQTTESPAPAPRDGPSPFRDNVRSPRWGRTPRAREAILAEIVATERLRDVTDRGSPDRPELLRRLGDAYQELEDRTLRERRNGFKPVAREARRKAIERYTALLRDHRSWCHDPASAPDRTGCADEVLYTLAFEYELAGDLDNARAKYLELVENYGQSRLVPDAYTALGDVQVAEAQGDPAKRAYAQNFYDEALKHDPPDNRLWPYAALQLAEILEQRGDRQGALEQLRRVVETTAKFPDLRKSREFGAQASQLLRRR